MQNDILLCDKVIYFFYDLGIFQIVIVHGEFIFPWFPSTFKDSLIYVTIERDKD